MFVKGSTPHLSGKWTVLQLCIAWVRQLPSNGQDVQSKTHD